MNNLRSLLFATLATSAVAFAQNPVSADSPYQVRYASNLTRGASVINLTNTGASGAGLQSGTSPSITGTICVNIYAYDPGEEIVSCCSCPVTPNGLDSIDVQSDLVANGLGRATPTAVVIKLVATRATGGTCNNSALLTNVTLANGTLAPGMAAWGTTLHAAPTGGYSVTETAFTPSSLSAGELARLQYGCGIVANNGSGFGVCASCRVGGLGAVKTSK